MTYVGRVAGVAVAAALLLSSCRGEVDPDWVEATLPVPDGPAGRLAVRDAVHCGGVWWAVGGVVLHQPSETQDARPAAWRSTDGRTWEASPVTATTYWGRRAILSGIACSGERWWPSAPAPAGRTATPA